MRHSPLTTHAIVRPLGGGLVRGARTTSTAGALPAPPASPAGQTARTAASPVHGAAHASERRLVARAFAHDTKNLLWAAIGHAALLEDGLTGGLTAEQRARVGRIRALVSEAERALAHALATAFGESDLVASKPTEVALPGLLASCAERYRAAANLAGLRLTTRVGSDVRTIHTDPAHVASIVGNLLANAIKYTPAGGRVALRAYMVTPDSPRRPGGVPLVAIEVRDTGLGIPAHLRERVFEEDFRAAPPDAAAGSGIGLTASRRLAGQLGGTLRVLPAHAPGTLVRLLLPARPGRADAR